jgi:hyaluronate lyase
VENVFVPLYFHGVSMDNAAGRGIAAGPGNELDRAGPNMEAIYRVAVGSNEPARSRMLGNIKSWLIDRPALQTPSNLVMADKYAELLADGSIKPAERTGLYARNWESRTYWNTDDFMFSISQNNANAGNGMFEASNANSGSYQENRKNIHSGDGMTYLYTADDPEIYQGDFWATVDYKRLPGTTQEWKIDTIMYNAAATTAEILPAQAF